MNTSWMRVWWIAYNKKLFSGELPMPTFLVAPIDHCGECTGVAITMSAHLLIGDKAKATMLHEMVHQWQYVKGKAMDHGHDFKVWADLIAVETKLEI